MGQQTHPQIKPEHGTKIATTGSDQLQFTCAAVQWPIQLVF